VNERDALEPSHPVKKNRWVWAQLAANTGATAVSTTLPIYIIQLGGTVLNVAFLTTLYNSIVLPCQLFWGVVTDRLGRRRLFFVITNTGAAIAYLAMFFFASVTSVTLAYGFLGAVIAANTASASLLVMETSPRASWSAAFVSFSLAANSGGIIGLIAGVIWSSFIPLHDFFLFGAASAAVALLLTFRLVPETSVPLETARLFLNPAAQASRMFHGVAERLQPSHVSTVAFETPGRIIRRLSSSDDPGRRNLFLSLFFFMTGQTVQTTSFTPFLLAYGVGGNEVFAVTLASNVLQTGGYRWMSSNVSRIGEERLGTIAIIVRTVLYATICLSTFLLMGFDLFLFAVAVNGLIGITWTVWNPVVNVMLFSSLGKERRGGIIGQYNAVSTFGLILGALASGFISYHFGYAITFVVSSGLCIVSLVVLRGAFRRLPVQSGRLKT
jgi:MFS family permease